jgi:ribosome-binding protein aMBF1 (putative translation factor)
MRLKLVKLEEYTGNQATIYSLLIEDDEITLYEMNKAESHNSLILKQLAENTPQSMVEKINRQMALAVRIEDAIKAKNWSKKEFAQRMGKKPSEISRWVSGCHNFTTDTLWHIEDVLHIRLLLIDENFLVAA